MRPDVRPDLLGRHSVGGVAGGGGRPKRDLANVKRFARVCGAAACRASMILRLAESRTRGRLVILCYHRVLPAESKAACPFPDLVVTPEAFRQQCLTLRRHYHVLPLSQAMEMLRACRAAPRPLAAVTFDDGYRDNARYAVPILMETGIKATFFVLVRLVGTDQMVWYDRLAQAVAALQRRQETGDWLAKCGLTEPAGYPSVGRDVALFARQLVARAKAMAPDRRRQWVDRLWSEASVECSSSSDDRMMDWQQLADLARSGHEIGSHGATHEILPQLDGVSLESEVAGSRRLLEGQLNERVVSFCYPNGDCDARVVQAVRSAGYAWAVTASPGLNNPGQDVYRLNRRFIHEDRLAGLDRRSSEVLMRMELCGLTDVVFGRCWTRER